MATTQIATYMQPITTGLRSIDYFITSEEEQMPVPPLRNLSTLVLEYQRWFKLHGPADDLEYANGCYHAAIF